MFDEHLNKNKVEKHQANQKKIIDELKENAVPAVRVIAKEKRKPFSLVEIILIIGIALSIFVMLLFNIYASMNASTMNRRVQDVQAEIKETETKIDNLAQHKHELTQRERLQEVADKYGLEIDNESVIHLKP